VRFSVGKNRDSKERTMAPCEPSKEEDISTREVVIESSVKLFWDGPKRGNDQGTRNQFSKRATRMNTGLR